MEIIERIRKETEASHMALQAELGFLLSPQVMVSDIIWWLSRLYSFVRPLETTLDQCTDDQWIVAYKSPKKSRLLTLQQDLTKLGLSQGDQEALGQCDNLPTFSGTADWLGYLYVLEGSTLGGSLIERHLVRSLSLDGLGGRPALGYFALYGDDTGKNWRQFIKLLNDFAKQSPDQAERLCSSAQMTFAKLHQWLRSGPRTIPQKGRL